jgi:hypothetical protein
LHHLDKPGLDVRFAFGAVYNEVEKVTNHRQLPAIYASLGGDNISLVPQPPVSVTSAEADVKADYDRVRQIGTRKEAWEAFIKQYPKGFCSDLARVELEKLLAEDQRIARAAEEAKAAEQARIKAAEDAQPVISTKGRRVALVIGNSHYQFQPTLDNPLRDAQVIANSLQTLGFQKVVTPEDVTRDQFMTALRDFAIEADGAEWAVVYFSGHGIEIGGTNYMISVDARLRVDRDAELETIELNKVMTAVGGARKLRLVILDACRDNPFIPLMQRTIASRGASGRGLAPARPEAGTLVVYSAEQGQIAYDGKVGMNSPFVSSLVQQLQTPNLEVRRLFDRVRDDVLDATNGQQQPFYYGSLPGREDFYFLTK